jgi:TolB-like protein
MKCKLFILGLAVIFSSCVSLQDRELSVDEKNEAAVLGNVRVEFISYQFLHIQNKYGLKAKAHEKLLEIARRQYGDNVDVRNIIISGSFTVLEAVNIGVGLGIAIPAGLLIGDGIYQMNGKPYAAENIVGGAIAGTAIGFFITGNTQKITATGDVVSLTPTAAAGRRRASQGATTGIEGAINRASMDIINQLPANSTIAVISISSSNRDMALFIVDELEYQLVDARKFTVVDRKTLDTIRTEQNFQMSGEVSDASAVSIGQMLGANIVITGSVSGTGSTQRLSIKALDVMTAQILTMAREAF